MKNGVIFDSTITQAQTQLSLVDSILWFYCVTEILHYMLTSRAFSSNKTDSLLTKMSIILLQDNTGQCNILMWLLLHT